MRWNKTEATSKASWPEGRSMKKPQCCLLNLSSVFERCFCMVTIYVDLPTLAAPDCCLLSAPVPSGKLVRWFGSQREDTHRTLQGIGKVIVLQGFSWEVLQSLRSVAVYFLFTVSIIEASRTQTSKQRVWVYGDKGCAWSHKQTASNLRPHFNYWQVSIICVWLKRKPHRVTHRSLMFCWQEKKLAVDQFACASTPRAWFFLSVRDEKSGWRSRFSRIQCSKKYASDRHVVFWLAKRISKNIVRLCKTKTISHLLHRFIFQHQKLQPIRCYNLRMRSGSWCLNRMVGV